MNTTPDNNEDSAAPPRPCPAPATPQASIPQKRKPGELVPMEGGPGVGHSLAALLKSPGSILYELTNGPHPGRLALSLWAVTVLGLLAFGGITGSISQSAWWEAPVKITGGVLFAALICLPSLYIFSALSGMALAIAGILLSTTGLTALLLAGFTPLVWVFGESTASLCFMGGLLLAVWLFSLLFGLNLLLKCSRALGMTDGVHLWIWCLMFLLVTLQVSTAVRPILGSADSFLPTEKKFFLQHWAENLRAESERGRNAAATGATD
jgi:hypothetical protein